MPESIGCKFNFQTLEMPMKKKIFDVKVEDFRVKK